MTLSPIESCRSKRDDTDVDGAQGVEVVPDRKHPGTPRGLVQPEPFSDPVRRPNDMKACSASIEDNRNGAAGALQVSRMVGSHSGPTDRMSVATVGNV